MGIKPLAFVAMPFGRKRDPSGNMEIDFDYVYQQAIEPAACKAGVDVIRADEERMGGFIHAPMYERLLLAEIVVADLTLANPNVFYELGVRHAARPRSTIMIYNEGAVLPFDVRPLRATPYHLEGDGTLTPEAALKLRDLLIEKLRGATDEEVTDSPLFQLIPDFPGIRLSHESTETFRNRIKYMEHSRARIEAARLTSDSSKAVEQLVDVESDLMPLTTAQPELLVDLLLAYRDFKAWDRMIQLIEAMPPSIAQHRTIQEQLGFALNRRNGDGDRERAIVLLKKVIEIHGANPETCGILGRVYKDLYDHAKSVGSLRASSHLASAVYWYREGFESDPRDYYPGINAANLLFEQGDDQALQQLRNLVPVVQFAVARRGGLLSRDHWDVATALQLAVLGGDWPLVGRALERFSVVVTHAWMVETTLQDLVRIRGTMVARGGEVAPLDHLIERLSQLARSLP